MAQMTEEHKRALAKGRRQAKIVRNYLQALQKDSRRGPKLDEKSLRKRVDDLHKKIEEEDDPARRLELVQKRLDYENQLDDIKEEPDIEELEKSFIEVAKEYSERKGITYKAWREEGVPAATLRSAGLRRGGS